MRKKIVALIPARSGSKRLKNKNIKKLKKHPLIAYTIKAAVKSKIFDEIICVTDSFKYKKIAEKYGAKVPYLRPKQISKEKSPDIDWVIWIMNKIEKRNKYHIFSILRPTNPLRNEETIKRAFKIFFNTKCDSLRAVDLCKQHPYKMWKIKNNFMKPIFNFKNKTPYHSRQYADLPKIHVQNASLEIAWTRLLKKKYPTISGKRIASFVSKGNEGYDINTKLDFDVLEYLIKKKVVKLKKI